MSEAQNRRWLLVRRPDGPVGPSNFRWSTGPIPTPGQGQMLVRNLYLSSDPTQVLVMAATKHGEPEELNDPPIPLGEAMRGIAVSQVVESQLPGFRPGDLVHGMSGWEDYSLVTGRGFNPTYVVPPGISPLLAAGALGLTGLVAYFGITEIARPRPGETVVVTAAAGGVGSVAVQLAKLQGAKVVGIAGGKEKCDWLRQGPRLEGVIDHRSEDVGASLDRLCPGGIDVLLDTVGGPMLDHGLARLRSHGRVVLTGATSLYAASEPVPGPQSYLQLVMVNGRMEGFLGRDYVARYPEAISALKAWIDAGKLVPKEDVLPGLENTPKGLVRVYARENVGKQLVKVADLAGPTGRTSQP